MRRELATKLQYVITVLFLKLDALSEFFGKLFESKLSVNVFLTIVDVAYENKILFIVLFDWVDLVVSFRF